MSAGTLSRVVTEPLGGSALARAVQERRLPDPLQPWWPAGAEAWREHLERVRQATAMEWYARLGSALSPAAGSAAQARLERTVQARGVVVTTGQQAGLFGGPLYTLAKALTAIALADELEGAFQVPVAPIFWAATDDADFDEASVAHVADANGLHALALRKRPAAGTIMDAFPLPAREMAALGDRLRSASGSGAHPEFLAAATDAFATGRTLGAAYVAQLRALLEPLGMAVMDSSRDAYRETARPLLRAALEQGEDIAQQLAATAGAIRHAGYEPQVTDDRGLSLVFAVEQGVKRRIPIGSRVAEPAGTPLSPNVLLRPVVERALLPTVAYVAGPGELAYFAQSAAVAEALHVAVPVGVPRWSGTIIEAFAERAVRRLGVDWRELADRHGVERRLAAAAMPTDIAVAWSQLRKATRDGVAGLGAAVRRDGLLPDEVIEGLGRAIEHRLQRGERRLLAAVKRRDARVRQDLAIASGALFPNGARQERVLNFVPMLTRGGLPLLEELQRAARLHASALVQAGTREPVTSRS